MRSGWKPRAAEGGAFETSVAHMESLYRLLQSELVGEHGDAIRAFFAAKDRPCVWVPDYRYEAATVPRDRYDGSFRDDDGKLKRVPGRFYALDACVWADHSRVLDSCVHRGVEAPRVLQRHYATLQRFWCRMFCRACFAARLGARGRLVAATASTAASLQVFAEGPARPSGAAGIPLHDRGGARGVRRALRLEAGRRPQGVDGRLVRDPDGLPVGLPDRRLRPTSLKR